LADRREIEKLFGVMLTKGAIREDLFQTNSIMKRFLSVYTEVHEATNGSAFIYCYLGDTIIGPEHHVRLNITDANVAGILRGMGIPESRIVDVSCRICEPYVIPEKEDVIPMGDQLGTIIELLTRAEALAVDAAQINSATTQILNDILDELRKR